MTLISKRELPAPPEARRDKSMYTLDGWIDMLNIKAMYKFGTNTTAQTQNCHQYFGWVEHILVAYYSAAFSASID